MYDQILTKNWRVEEGAGRGRKGKRKKGESRVLTSLGRKKRKRSPIRSNNCRPGFEELKPALKPRGWKNHFVRGVKFSGS